MQNHVNRYSGRFLFVMQGTSLVPSGLEA